MDKRPVLIMAGGTGGHIYPALAVAKALQADGVPVVWMGTRAGLEAKVIPMHKLPIKWLSISGLRGKGKFSLLIAPFKLVSACLQARSILKELKPRCVLGMGGFVSGPGGLMASLMDIPLVIHEQNAIAGLTNRLLAKRASVVLTAFPRVFSPEINERFVGNPLRDDIVNIGDSSERVNEVLGSTETSFNLLVLGGSLGAQALNATVPEAVARAQSNNPQLTIRVRHQTGTDKRDATVNAYKAAQFDAQVDSYINDMSAAYQWADLIICRAGAMTIAEVSAMGVPSILVPFPHAVDDHQTANARCLSETGAAVLLPQDELNTEGLSTLLIELMGDSKRLLDMAEKTKAQARLSATTDVKTILLESVHD